MQKALACTTPCQRTLDLQTKLLHSMQTVPLKSERTKIMESYFSDDQNNNAKRKEKSHAKGKTRNTMGRRAHHNALEQKRRGVIRGCFENLRKSVPSLDSEEKKLSRSGILRETARYIKATKERVTGYQADIDSLRLQNQLLSAELECLECIPSETSPFYKEFDSFTNGLMKSTLQTSDNRCYGGAQTDITQIGESTATDEFPNGYMKDFHQEFVGSTDSFSQENNLTGKRGYHCSNFQQHEMEINQNISKEEEFDIDIEGFGENSSTRY